jgi:hypothetical protein
MGSRSLQPMWLSVARRMRIVSSGAATRELAVRSITLDVQVCWMAGAGWASTSDMLDALSK